MHSPYNVIMIKFTSIMFSKETIDSNRWKGSFIIYVTSNVYILSIFLLITKIPHIYTSCIMYKYMQLQKYLSLVYIKIWNPDLLKPG